MSATRKRRGSQWRPPSQRKARARVTMSRARPRRRCPQTACLLPLLLRLRLLSRHPFSHHPLCLCSWIPRRDLGLDSATACRLFTVRSLHSRGRSPGPFIAACRARAVSLCPSGESCSMRAGLRQQGVDRCFEGWRGFWYVEFLFDVVVDLYCSANVSGY
jgi:hypothetical protein